MKCVCRGGGEVRACVWACVRACVCNKKDTGDCGNKNIG